MFVNKGFFITKEMCIIKTIKGFVIKTFYWQKHDKTIILQGIENELFLKSMIVSNNPIIVKLMQAKF